jgi:hypothetical protein
VGERRHGLDDPVRRRRHRGHHDRDREPVDTVPAGDPMAEHDVEHEAGAVRGRPGQTGGTAVDADLREQQDTGHRQGEGAQVAPAAHAVRRQGHHAEELDAGDRRQWRPVECEVERRVHRGEGEPEGDRRTPLGGRGPDEHVPRATPHGQDDRGRGEPQPGDAEGPDVDEQQDRERGTEVVEPGAEDDRAERGGADRGAGAVGAGLREGGGHRSILRGDEVVLKG